MFSLIISIIAIALVAALALASIYYGGEAFNKGTTDADASTIINQGQQIQAAITMADIDRNENVTALADLVDDGNGNNYLQEVPTFQSLTWGAPGAAVAGYSDLSGSVNADVCIALNEKVGAADPEAVTAQTGVFGCINGTNTPFYRVGEFYTAG